MFSLWLVIPTYIKLHIHICMRGKKASFMYLKKIKELKIPAYFSQDNHFYKRQYLNLWFGSVKNSTQNFNLLKILNSF